jgi:NAD(P)-dependent dehydrogenase (short-subunit alcohol dehydrogenase family)
MSDQNGRVALITGAAGGIGQALAREFVAAGMRVGLSDVNAEALHALAAELGPDAFAHPADVSDPAACVALVAAVREKFGGLHALVNNAALGMGAIRADHHQRTVTIDDVSVEQWQRFLAVNLTGPFCMVKAVMPIFRSQKFGRIINVTTSFFTMLRPGFYPYGVAKSGLEAWSTSLAAELDGSGITVNVVIPGGPADTPMVPPESGYAREDLIRPAALAPPMLHLMSDAGGTITGCRFIAARWDPNAPVADAIARAGSPTGWPDLTANRVFQDQKP